MTEEQEVKEIELSEETHEILSSLNPQIILNENGEGKHKLIYDGESLEKVIQKIKGSNEIIGMESDLLGIRCSMSSKHKSITELQEMCHKSMEFLTKSIPCRVPLGVG